MAEHLNSRSAPVMGLMGIKSDQGAADMKHNNYILCSCACEILTSDRLVQITKDFLQTIKIDLMCLIFSVSF